MDERGSGRDRWLAFGAAVGTAVSLFVISTIAYTKFPPAMKVHPTPHAPTEDGFGWLGAWSWWDGAWYVGIHDHGYFFTPGRQSSVAFFPAYPVLMRAVSGVLGNPLIAGFLITVVCGIGAGVLFHRWAVGRLGRRTGNLALAVFLLYPCSFYLFGALYADALFLAAAIGAFVLLEKDDTVLAGLAAALATAARPVGVALVIGLWARTLERRGVFEGRRLSLSRLLPRDAGLLLAPGGLVAYSGYLWARFGEPFAFLEAERGWGQEPGPRTWFKFAWFAAMGREPYLHPRQYHLVGSLLLTIIAVALVVVVFRKLGWAYGLYAGAMIGGAMLSTKDFVGMGRYVIAAFPCFAAMATVLDDRQWTRRVVLGVSGALLFLFTELHARNMLIS